MVYNQNVIEPRVNKITEQLNVVEGGEVKETLEPIFRPAQYENLVNTTQVPLPANKYVNQPIIQPIVEKENIKIRFVDGRDKLIENEPIERKPIIQEKFRTETIERPGDVYYKQDVIRPMVTRENLQVKFEEPAPEFS